MRHPAARVVVRFGRLRSRLHQRLNQGKQRGMQVAQPARLSRPIVHLDVYIQVPVRVQGVSNSSAQTPCRLAGSPPGRDDEISRYRPY